MGRIKRQALMLAISVLVFIFAVSSLYAERTKEFESLLKRYQKQYDFMSTDDTVYTFESEFKFPEGYHRIDSTKMSAYANWISHFPLWHRWKPVGKWGGAKYYEADQISRAVHLPWINKSFKDYNIPIRLLAEFLLSQHREFDLKIIPKSGDTLTYEKWLNGKPAYTSRLKFFFKPAPKRDSSVKEYFQYLELCKQNTDYRSLTYNCDKVSENNLNPGDMLIAYDSTNRKGLVYIILNTLINKKKEKLYVVATGCPQACDFHIPLINKDRDYPWLTIEQVKNLVSGMPVSGFFRFKVIKKIK
ncbi:MAG: DUF4846 domain-containing protein [FCB group bacterium]|nr:DUF4846 domain-containing protein [FCB group bacterium]